jgi:hypothetical protein
MLLPPIDTERDGDFLRSQCVRAIAIFLEEYCKAQGSSRMKELRDAQYSNDLSVMADFWKNDPLIAEDPTAIAQAEAAMLTARKSVHDSIVNEYTQFTQRISSAK